MLLDQGIEVSDNPYKRKLTEDEIIAHLEGATGLIAGLEPLNERVFAARPELKVIARVGIGMDNVDQEAAKRHGIKVSNTPDGPTAAVAELTLAALLSIARGVSSANAALHAGKWEKRIGFSLAGLKVLIIGYGRIGQCTAALLRTLYCEVKSYDPHQSCDFQSLEAGLQWAEVISLHASGNERILGAAEVDAMQDGVVILNSARGGLIDEDALFQGLQSGKIQACWLDVFSREPYTGKLVQCDNALLTPHIATYSKQCRLSMESQAVSNLLRDLHDVR